MGMFDNVKEMGKLKQMADAAKKESATLRASGRSKRGFVTVSLDGEKNIKRLEIIQDAMSLPADELAKLIKEAHRVACKEIDKQLKKQMKNSGLANMLMGK
jgi:DNA-binding protein YbaB